ncbi:hypothetical protein [Inquilinus limosus]|uniref:hypothetical protein n=1 Tax=Inquilinus limosus TaxID=171674 RepID=UPI0012DE6A67|nr:hypothetical protein [Inquilinus limosus]
MICSIKKAQTNQGMDPAAASAEERAARHLRMLARLAEMGVEVAEATRTEAVEAPQPGVDYCQRFATAARAVRLTVLLEDSFARQAEEQRRAAAMVQVGTWHRQRLRQAVVAAVDEAAESTEEACRRSAEAVERLERPELAEIVELYPAEVAVARLCRTFGLPAEAGRWLELADEVLEDFEIRPPDGAALADPPADPSRSHPARSRRPRAPDTG